MRRFWRKRGAKEEPAPPLCPAAAFTGRFGALLLALGLFASALTLALAGDRFGFALRSIGTATAIMTVFAIGFSTRLYTSAPASRACWLRPGSAWQRRHGRRVLFDGAGDDGVRLYAAG